MSVPKPYTFLPDGVSFRSAAAVHDRPEAGFSGIAFLDFADDFGYAEQRKETACGGGLAAPDRAAHYQRRFARQRQRYG